MYHAYVSILGSVAQLAEPASDKGVVIGSSPVGPMSI